MIYEALVIDNADFAEKGTIRVRIKQMTLSPTMVNDLSEDPKKSIDTYGKQQWRTRNGKDVFTYVDTDVKVSSPFGGGYDYGVFYLPQPNSWGLVGRIGDPWEENSRNNFVWLGALYQRNVLNGDINIPSNSLDTKYNGVVGDGEEQIVNLDNFSSTLVIKTKTTSISGGAQDINQEESKKTLDWEKRPTENLIIIDKDKVQVTHNVLDDNEESKAVETFQVDSDGFIINYYDKSNSRNSYFKLKDNGDFEINKEAEDANISLTGNDSGVTVDYADTKDNGANLVLGKKSSTSGGSNKTEATLTAFENGKSTCILSVKSNGITIESNGDVNISSKGNVTLGNTGLPVLVSPTGSDIVVGNVTLPCSSKVLG